MRNRGGVNKKVPNVGCEMTDHVTWRNTLAERR